MAENQSFDLHELYQRILLEAHAAWRYRWHALIVTWCVAIAGALLVFSMPNQYEARAQVYADTDALMNPLLRGLAVQPDIRGRLDIITHTLLARPNLETVADQTGLSLRATTPEDKDELLMRLGATVRIKDAGARNLYNISYSDPDPQMAQKVVQAFLQILMNDTLGANTASMQTALTFLKRQVDDYNGRLNMQEKKIADFKKANVAYLRTAGGDGDYFTRLQEAKADLQTLRARHARPHSAAAAARGPAVQQIDKQIAVYQQQLDTLLLKYTPEFPDVVSTQRMIGQLKTRREALLGGNGGSAGASDATAAGVTSQTRSRSALAARITAKQQEIATLEQGLDKSTDAQTTLQQLGRDYDLTRKQYDELVARLNTAQLSQDATQSGNNLKFRVISPPIAPLLPVSPKRGLLLAVVFAFALLAGAAFAFFLHKIRPVFVSLKDLRSFGDYPALGTLGLLVSPAQHKRRRREVIGFSTGVVVLALVVAVGFASEASLARLVQHVFTMGVT